MWKYIISIVFYPFMWLWNNIICMDIYGVKPVQIFALVAFGVALYRFIIVPMAAGFSVNMVFPHVIRAKGNNDDDDVQVIGVPNPYHYLHVNSGLNYYLSAPSSHEQISDTMHMGEFYP